MTVTPLRVARRPPGRDLAAAERAAAAFLAALGVDCDAEGLAETPARMARSYAELLTPREFRLTTFPLPGERILGLSKPATCTPPASASSSRRNICA